MRNFVSGTFLALLVCLSPHAIAQDVDVTDIVLAQDAFIADTNDETRADLVAALADYRDAPTVETVKGYLAVMLHDTASGDYERMFESASATRDHLEPVSDLLPQQYAEARYVAAVGQFNSDLNEKAMIEMAHVEGFARSYRDETGEQPKWADGLKWKADAWGMAMDAYFESSRKRHPDDDEIDDILAGYAADTDALNAVASQSVDESGLPFCSGKMIQKPKMRYPSGREMRGRYGAVILGMDFDAEGKVINPQVLASVPFEQFDEKSMQTVGKWRFKPDDRKQVGVTCRLHRTDVVQPLIFLIR